MGGGRETTTLMELGIEQEQWLVVDARSEIGMAAVDGRRAPTSPTHLSMTALMGSSFVGSCTNSPMLYKRDG